jgi:Fumarase C-terminus
MEAVWQIEVRDFPAFIITDDKGNDFFAGLAGGGGHGPLLTIGRRWAAPRFRKSGPEFAIRRIGTTPADRLSVQPEHPTTELLGSRRPGCPWLAFSSGLARDCLGPPLTTPAPITGHSCGDTR